MSNGKLVTKPFKSGSSKESSNDITNRNNKDETSNMNSATELTKEDINEPSASILDEVLEDWDFNDGLLGADPRPVSSSTLVPALSGTILYFILILL